MSETSISRRSVLRGALATGCCLCLPVALAAETKKVTQASVQYQPKPKGNLKCAACVNFIAASSTCRVVDGPISPDGWCTLWAKKP